MPIHIHIHIEFLFKLCAANPKEAADPFATLVNNRRTYRKQKKNQKLCHMIFWNLLK